MNRREFLQAAASSVVAFPAPIPVSPPTLQHISPIIIIGAGMSGLAAARELIDNCGVAAGSILILEARNRIGGRIFTNRELGYAVDMGASWIHGVTGNPITALADQYGAQRATTDYESLNLYDADGSLLSNSQIIQAYWRQVTELDNLLQYRNGLTTDQSIHTSLQAIGALGGASALQRRITNWLYYNDFQQGLSQSPTQLGTLSFNEGNSFNGDDQLFPNGYDQIINGMAAGLNIRMGHVVEQIDYSGSGVQIQTNQGTFNGSHCIITLPLGVLKAGAVEFTPGLPANINTAIQNLTFGNFFKMAMHFPSRFWGTGTELFGKIGTNISDYGEGDQTVFFNMDHYLGQNALLMFAGADYAATMEAMSEADAVAEAMAKLRAMFEQTIPNPTMVTRSDWTQSPYTRGSYTYWGVGSDSTDNNAFTQLLNGAVTFAGEHTNATYGPTVHSAYLSGVAAAQRICPTLPPLAIHLNQMQTVHSGARSLLWSGASLATVTAVALSWQLLQRKNAQQ